MEKHTAPYEKTYTTNAMPVSIFRLRFSSEEERIRARHWHRSMEIAFHEKADGVTYIDGKEYPMSGEALVLINSRCVHEIRNHVTAGSTSTVMLVPYDLLKKEIPEFDDLIFSVESNDSIMIELHKEIYEAAHSGSTYAALNVSALLYKMFYYLCENCAERKIQGINISAFTDREWGDKVSQYLNTCFADAVSVSEISAHFNYTQEAFCRKFRKVFGCSPYNLLTRIRLQQAVKLLRTTEERPAKIAESCGFLAVRNLKNNLADKTGLTIDEIRKMTERDYSQLMNNLG